MSEVRLSEKCPHSKTAQTNPASPQLEQPSKNRQNNKRKKRNTWIALAAVLGFIIILSAIAFAFFGGPQHNLTAFNEHLVIYSHTSSGTQTVTYLFHLDEAGKHPAGKQIVIEVPYHYQGIGIENITRMECNTPGFNLAGVSPALPVRLPNTPTIEAGSITLKITFDTPQEPYTGAFDFTVYYDQYP
jgi:hypothetical protein